MSTNLTPKLIFVTGTNTGVGKTLLTGMLLDTLRRSGVHALAMKPFCSGGRSDVEFLRAIQDQELSLEEINPFYFNESVAPLIAARKHRRSIRLDAVLERIHTVASRCDRLLIEGAGGLLVPLGPFFTVADLIARLDCEVIVVSRNQLGTINHTLLTVEVLQHRLLNTRSKGAASLQRLWRRRLQVVLMDQGDRDASTASNGRVLAEMLAPIPVTGIACLGRDPVQMEALKRNRKKINKSLARVIG